MQYSAWMFECMSHLFCFLSSNWAATWERFHSWISLVPPFQLSAAHKESDIWPGFSFLLFPTGFSFVQALYFYRFKLLHSKKKVLFSDVNIIASLNCLTFELISKMVFGWISCVECVTKMWSTGPCARINIFRDKCFCPVNCFFYLFTMFYVLSWKTAVEGFAEKYNLLCIKFSCNVIFFTFPFPLEITIQFWHKLH